MTMTMTIRMYLKVPLLQWQPAATTLHATWRDTKKIFNSYRSNFWLLCKGMGCGGLLAKFLFYDMFATAVFDCCLQSWYSSI